MIRSLWGSRVATALLFNAIFYWLRIGVGTGPWVVDYALIPAAYFAACLLVVSYVPWLNFLHKKPRES